MKKKVTSYKLQVTVIVFLVILLFFTVAYYLKPVLAQTANCNRTYATSRAEGLVTSSTITSRSKFSTSNSGACAIDSKNAFAPFAIPSYNSLKTTYYDQSKLTKNVFNNVTGNFNADGIYKSDGDLTVNANITGSGTQLIFVGGNLNINKDINYHTNDGDGGLVFIVSGNVYIDPNVVQIDAVIISYGTIYTAASASNTCSNTSPVSTPQLVINGSLISLGDSDIHFCRTLSDNKTAAEIVNSKFKYLVLLRNLMSTTLQKWSEVP